MLPHAFLVLLALPQGQPALPSPLPLGNVDVPLSRMPDQPDIGSTAGVSFLDYDADGWIDIFVNYTGLLWRNDHGTLFTRVADLDRFLPPIGDRYGAAAGDFDADGLPDIACEPRGDCFYLLRNLDGATNFQEIASDPELVLDRPPCTMYAETFCWADLDEDGDLDLFASAYQDEVQPGSGGNRFFENLGPTGPGGAYRLALRTLESGLGNPPNTSRPEGVQAVDVDRDGDVDIYSGGTTFQNVTTTDGPRFVPLVRGLTGITLANRLDEGACYFDYDLDGDPDLLVVYQGGGNRVWENRGDGTFFEAVDLLENPGEGATQGCSAEDWDLDGDLDVTTGHVFRRNLLVETGTRFLRIATHSIPPSFLGFPSPAWGDWDLDGDADVVIANWRGRGRLYRNDSYGTDTGTSQKLTVRVRPVNDSALVARGLETEFGATVELRAHGDASGFVRRRFTAASHGYLQQSEYALTMVLPAGPDPDEPARGVVFDLLVDFPGLAASGVLRIDRDVNPVLGDVELATLVGREITVFRSGAVEIDGALVPPAPGFEHRLGTTGALVLPALGAPLDDPLPAPAPGWVVGLELESPADGAVRASELVLDGQLAPAGAGRCDANVVLWDVTPGAPPRLVRAESLATSPRNRRSYLALDWLLKPARRYRLLCRVSALRASPVAPAGGPLLVNGALSFALTNPCAADVVSAAPLVLDARFCELRARASAPPSKDTRR